MSTDFSSQVYQLAERIEQTKEHIKTEEATKMSFIVPFFQILGYDVYNPTEFVPEYIADVGNKKGEKVDYAILRDGSPVILVEAKPWFDQLTNHDSQLYRYFTSTQAKFAILTNGILYKFFTDLDAQNLMDSHPFLEINLLDLKENHLVELKKFVKDAFDLDAVFSAASEMKYSTSIKAFISSQLSSPSEDFVRYVLGNVYDGTKTQAVVEKFTPLVKKSMNQLINDILNERLSSVINPDTSPAVIEQVADDIDDMEENVEISKIITTDEELQAFYIVKSIFAEMTPLEKIIAKDTETYFGILYENNTRKWICRLKLSPKRKLLIMPNTDGSGEAKFALTAITDIYKYRNELVASLNRFL